MMRDEALIIAEEILSDRAGLQVIADEIMKAWSEGYATGDQEGYNRGYDAAKEEENA